MLFQIVADNGGRHTEHVLYIFVDYLYIFNKAIMPPKGEFWNSLFFPLDEIPIISFGHYAILMQFRCIVYATDGSQISSLIMDALYIKLAKRYV